MSLPKRRAHLLTATLLACATLDLHADPGIGPAPGNALNPQPFNPSTAGRWMDPDGLGTRSPAARSPSGQLYNVPLDPGLEDEERDRSAWKTSGFAELGGIHVGGDDRSQGFRNYKDLKSGAYLNIFGLTAERADQARFIEVVGGGVGMRDPFYRFQAGRYNDWKVSAFYEGTPQAFTSGYRSLWNGLGTAELTLATLKPGGTSNAATTQANILEALAVTQSSTLEVIRKKAGVRVDKNLGESWKAYASFVAEKREGARPFGAVFGGGGGGGNMEIAEPIDYLTRDFLAGLQFNDAASSLNLRASASFFRNEIDTLSFQNPLYISLNGITGLAPASFTYGRFDLAPDNEHYNVKGEYARLLPGFFRGNFTAAVALGTMRQNDPLLTPTESALAGGTVTAGGASLANAWNTPAALSRQTADARIDTRLVDLGLALRPANGLDVKGKLRYYETDNSLQYLACNPLTGQWGRLLTDGSGLSLAGAHTGAGVNPAGTSANAYNAAGCDLAAVRALDLVPASGNIPIRAVPNDYRQVNASVVADYRLGRGRSMNASIEREAFRREFRERDETREDKAKLAYVDRATIDGSIRISYEHGRRGGSEYHPNPYEPFLSASFGPTPTANGAAMPTWLHSIGQFRSFDLADRKQDVFNVRANYAFAPSLDGAVTLQAKDARYPAQFGRTGHHKSSSMTLDVNYQPGAVGELYSFYSHQAGAMDQRGIHPGSCVIGTAGVTAANWMTLCGEASAASPLFPDSRNWAVASRDRNHVIGVGLRFDLGRAKVDTSFTRSLGRTRIGYRYDAEGLGLTPAQVALAGDGFSDLLFAQNVLNASVQVPINRNFAVRIVVRHESGRIRDWHYDGVADNPMPTNNAVYLDAGPQDYRATMIGLLLQVRM